LRHREVAGLGEYRIMGQKFGVFFQVMVLAVACLAQPAWAQFLTNQPCSSVSMQNARPGLRCTTSTGAEFRRYVSPLSGAMGWEEMGPGGRVWYDEVKINSSQPGAAAFCAAHPGQRVPGLDDFDRAGVRGLKEVIKDSVRDVHNPLLWSSQMDQASHGERAVGFALDAGDFHSALIAEPFDNAVIICVSAATPP
jgi:hypothetical protein